MNVRDLKDGMPGAWIAADAFRVDRDGTIWVDLDAPVQTEADPDADLLQIRRNRELSADEHGLKVGTKRLIEVPAEELARRAFPILEVPDEEKWGQITLWKPWGYSWTLKNLQPSK